MRGRFGGSSYTTGLTKNVITVVLSADSAKAAKLARGEFWPDSEPEQKGRRIHTALPAAARSFPAGSLYAVADTKPMTLLDSTPNFAGDVSHELQ
jgi:hypothetical protein